MYTKRLTENFVQKALLIFRYKVLKFIVDQIAIPWLADTESWRLPDSSMREIGESTKGKVIALDLYVCLLFQASVGYNAKNF
jgi:hypothetical protein